MRCMMGCDGIRRVFFGGVYKGTTEMARKNLRSN